jgi:hypothetical protein
MKDMEIEIKVVIRPSKLEWLYEMRSFTTINSKTVQLFRMLPYDDIMNKSLLDIPWGESRDMIFDFEKRLLAENRKT